MPDDMGRWNRDAIRLWQSGNKRRGWGQSTRHREERHVWAFLRWCIANEDLTPDVIRNLKPSPRPLEVSRRTADEETFRTLVYWARNVPMGGNGAKPTARLVRRNVALLHVLYSTGLRRAEIAAVRLEDYDRKEGLIYLPGEAAKSGKSRVLPLDPPARRALNEYLVRGRGSEPGPLFQMTSEAIRTMLARLSARAGVEASSHDFRRGFAARVRASGLDIGHTMQLLGHSTPTMTLIYSAEGEQDAAVRRFREVIG